MLHTAVESAEGTERVLLSTNLTSAGNLLGSICPASVELPQGALVLHPGNYYLDGVLLTRQFNRESLKQRMRSWDA